MASFFLAPESINAWPYVQDNKHLSKQMVYNFSYMKTVIDV
jgi:hypothetical protein